MTRPILPAAELRRLEQEAIAAGTSERELMERAGTALATASLRMFGPRDTLVLCGAGNNGGDGYVAARHLAQAGASVRVAAIGAPGTDAAKAARADWTGEVGALDDDTAPADLVIDCLFGTGLSRPLAEAIAVPARRLLAAARRSVACDLPSGVEADSGRVLTDLGSYDLTLALGALKPAHRLAPAIHACGRVASAAIGLAPASDWFEIAAPELPALDPDGHKFDRGMVHCLSGAMPGAIALSAHAAARAGAGYVRVSTSRMIDNLPSSIVQTEEASALDDPRIGCLLVGPGMGDIPPLLTVALTKTHPLVLDADALGHVGEPERLRGHDAILTPHEGEFVQLFGDLEGSKADRALQAGAATECVVVYKGPDTLVASPDGRLGFAPPAPPALATAGAGDVLAGIIAALRARGMDRFEAACAGVWLHGRAAEACPAPFLADDLVAAIPGVL
ncbi:NAD(P)H-hydrate dehydratase [Sphingomicrobium astaxanthinifaciens]|uniref:NAD(P)H-hydrate dehydratase n=1 Tax=Sphingomicrobium astaxanthinifaciens TaxID=1227949 RepID=UPI001FCC8BE0|nr:NAD(P)H-hydrate dehydratase [Sphingomicrobium astaxanthinifaciens]MCJ7422354.1 NAD(P)H-hydrate dehydratase [Sphingomicrobium astaxanthinifaciens]